MLVMTTFKIAKTRTGSFWLLEPCLRDRTEDRVRGIPI
jgi:hypothetical protein